MSKPFTLEKSFRRDWINALRSNEYSQTACSLYEKGKGFCAIGLAMYVCLDVSKEELEGEPTRESVSDSTGIPLKDLRIPWEYTPYGFSSTCNNLEEELMDMNDQQGLSFRVQAKWIIKNTIGVIEDAKPSKRN